MNFYKLVMAMTLTCVVSEDAAVVQYKRFNEHDTAIVNRHLTRYGLSNATSGNTRLRLMDGGQETPIFSVPVVTANHLLMQNSNLGNALGFVGSYGFKGIYTCVKYGTVIGAVTFFGLGCLTGNGPFAITTSMIGAYHGAVKGLAIGVGTGLPVGVCYGLYRYCYYTGIEIISLADLGHVSLADLNHVWIRIKELDDLLKRNACQTYNSSQALGFRVVNS